MKKGSKMSLESRRKLSISHKGQIPWNKGLKGVQEGANKGKRFSKEWCENLSIAQRKRFENPLERKRCSIALSKLWKNPQYRKCMIKAYDGRKAWNKGIPMQSEPRKKLSEAIKIKWQDPIYRNKVVKTLTGKKQSRETIIKRVKKLKGQKRTDEFKQWMRDINLGLKRSEATRVKISESKKGFIPWMVGKKHSEASKYKISQAKKGYKHTGQWKKEQSIRSKVLWQDPEYAKKVLTRRIPSSLEQSFIQLFRELKLPYKYVGNGELVFDGINPDFVNYNGTKIVVDVYYRYYKTIDGRTIVQYQRKRRNILSKYGYEIVFFDETECNKETILKKLT